MSAVKGKHLSEKHKRSISKALRGRTLTPRWRKAIGEAVRKAWRKRKRAA